MNLLVESIIANNHEVNRQLDELGYQSNGPEPEPQKSYKTRSGYTAVVEEVWNDYLILTIQNGMTVSRIERAF